MKRFVLRYGLCFALTLLIISCQGEKKVSRYESWYKEKPEVIYVAPVCDLSQRKVVRGDDDSIYNASLNLAAKHMYLSSFSPIITNGYYTLGALASAQFALAHPKTTKQLHNSSMEEYRNLGIDAVLLITIHNWSQSSDQWNIYVEYVLRSTHNNTELMHVWVKGAKQLSTNYKGIPIPLKKDIKFAENANCDTETAIRCSLVETLNKYVLNDIPRGALARSREKEPYTTAHPDYFQMMIRKDGTVEMLQMGEETNGFVQQ
ncbi:MAG: hypothetical protein IJ761_00820 [Bacteroidales bacterium]|nr:hypothetical protein [Bacteroidales bacterium]